MAGTQPVGGAAADLGAGNPGFGGRGWGFGGSENLSTGGAGFFGAGLLWSGFPQSGLQKPGNQGPGLRRAGSRKVALWEGRDRLRQACLQNAQLAGNPVHPAAARGEVSRESVHKATQAGRF